MTLDDVQVKTGSTLSDERSKGKTKGKNKTKTRAKPQQSEEENYTTCVPLYIISQSITCIWAQTTSPTTVYAVSVVLKIVSPGRDFNAPSSP